MSPTANTTLRDAGVVIAQAPPTTSIGLAARVAEVTRAAYTGSDPVPGLEPPDGIRESARSVEEQLATGTHLWTASDDEGSLVGCLRVTPHAEDGWEVHRVAVSPAWQGRGVAQALLNTVSAAATREQTPLWLNSVVERCLPPLYARLGYRPVRVFPGPGKPLTEWRMRWDPSENVPSRWYAAIEVAAERHLCWFVSDDVLFAVFDDGGPTLGDVVTAAARKLVLTRPALRGRRIGLAGIDAVPEGVEATHFGTPSGGDGVHRLAVPRVRHAFHLCPRRFEPAVLALCRFAPGREASIDVELVKET